VLRTRNWGPPSPFGRSSFLYGRSAGCAGDAPAGTENAGIVERLYREQGDRLWGALFAFAGDREVANDAVAEAFAQLLRRGQDVGWPGRWVWRAGFRIAAGELKERSRMVAARMDQAYEMPEPLGELLEALGRISPMQRASVLLHHGYGYPVKDVARILDSTTPAVKVHLSVGRRRLRVLLEEAEDAEPR
jgi:RNA polymerase sigma-70 factor, ECF subfamily